MYNLPNLTNVTEELNVKSIIAEIKEDETVFKKLIEIKKKGGLIMHELADLNNVTEEEIDKISIPAVVEDEQIIFDESQYRVENGIMFFERPLKVDLIDLNLSTLDRMSIIKSFTTDYTYVFAISAAEKFNKNLIEFSKTQKSDKKKYGFYVSWSSKEVDSID